MEYLLKINRMGRKAVVMAMGLGDDRTTSFDVAVQDYISESSLPLTSSLSSSADDNGASSDGGATTTTTTTRRMGEMKDRLRQVFISSYRLTDLAMLFKINIIQRIIPGLYKEGYQETLNDTTNPASSQQQQRRQPSSSSSSRHRQDNSSEPRSHLPEPARPYPIHDPLAILQPPRRPAVHPSGEFPPPGFDDEYDILRRPGRGGGEGGPPFERNPLSIGHDDLNPPGLGGPWGAIPPSVGGGGGGMHPTFDDPLFRGGGRRNNPYDPRCLSLSHGSSVWGMVIGFDTDIILTMINTVVLPVLVMIRLVQVMVLLPVNFLTLEVTVGLVVVMVVPVAEVVSVTLVVHRILLEGLEAIHSFDLSSTFLLGK